MKNGLLTFGILFLIFAGFAHATTISDCSNLDIADTYYLLDSDILVSPYNFCMNVTASNVTLDCQGNTIDGSADAGVLVNSTLNFTMLNCNVTNWGAGVLVNASNNTRITYSNFTTNTYGVLLQITDNTTIEDNLFNSSASSGIYVSVVTATNQWDNDNLFIRRNLFYDNPAIFFSGVAPVEKRLHNIIIEYRNCNYSEFHKPTISFNRLNFSFK